MAAGSRRRDPGGGHVVVLRTAAHVRRLVDLTGLGWQPITLSDNGIELAATCTLAEVSKLSTKLRHSGPSGRPPPPPPVLHRAAGVVQDLAHRNRRRQPLPVVSRRSHDLAGPGTRRRAHGLARRRRGIRVPVTEFVTGEATNVLVGRRVLRRFTCPPPPCAAVPHSASGPSPLGRSGWWSSVGTAGHRRWTIHLSVTAATVRPYLFRTPDTQPDADALVPRTRRHPRRRVDRRPARRPRLARAMTLLLAEQVLGGVGMTTDRKRPGLAGRTAAGPVPAHVPARAGPLRGQEGLRRRRLRRLHGARRRPPVHSCVFPAFRARVAGSPRSPVSPRPAGCTRCSGGSWRRRASSAASARRAS